MRKIKEMSFREYEKCLNRNALHIKARTIIREADGLSKRAPSPTRPVNWGWIKGTCEHFGLTLEEFVNG